MQSCCGRNAVAAVLWWGCCGRAARLQLQNCSCTAAATGLLWQGCCGQAVVARLLWPSCCGPAIVARLQWPSFCVAKLQNKQQKGRYTDLFHKKKSRMLCEGSPLFFYAFWGLVTASGTSHSARRLDRCVAGRPATDRRQTGDRPATDRRQRVRGRK